MRTKRRWHRFRGAAACCMAAAAGLAYVASVGVLHHCRAHLARHFATAHGRTLCGVQPPRGRQRIWRTERPAEDEASAGSPASRGDQEEQEDGAMDADWRKFRARLIQQESGDDGDEQQSDAKGWAHESPLIEQGSLLLSAAGDHFALNQQYFHKCVILIVEHNENGDVGLILNRPTAFTTGDFAMGEWNTMAPVPESIVIPGFGSFAELPTGDSEPWPIWCGGDCEGLNDETKQPFCLHTSPSFANCSTEIIPGVYNIQPAVARSLVAAKKAEPDDFMLLAGYCGWGKGQMQSELDRGDTWTLAVADQRVFLADLRKLQAETQGRIRAAIAEREIAGSEVPLSAKDIGNGVEQWEQMYVAFGEKNRKRLETAKECGDDEHCDEMLNRWIQRCLIPPSMRLSSAFSVAAAETRAQEFGNLTAGTVLYTSPTSWLLGAPAAAEEFGLRRFLPSQYLHKGVLLLLRDISAGESSVLALVNGPAVAQYGGSDVLFGGTVPQGRNILELAAGDNPIRVQGIVIFEGGVLEKVLALNALRVSDVDMAKLAETPKKDRWLVAGGKLETVHDTWASTLGDVQKRKWYKKFLDLDV